MAIHNDESLNRGTQQQRAEERKKLVAVREPLKSRTLSYRGTWRNTHKEACYVCPVCHKVFNRTDPFHRHIRRHCLGSQDDPKHTGPYVFSRVIHTRPQASTKKAPIRYTNDRTLEYLKFLRDRSRANESMKHLGRGDKPRAIPLATARYYQTIIELHRGEIAQETARTSLFYNDEHQDEGSASARVMAGSQYQKIIFQATPRDLQDSPTLQVYLKHGLGASVGTEAAQHPGKDVQEPLIEAATNIISRESSKDVCATGAGPLQKNPGTMPQTIPGVDPNTAAWSPMTSHSESLSGYSSFSSTSSHSGHSRAQSMPTAAYRYAWDTQDANRTPRGTSALDHMPFRAAGAHYPALKAGVETCTLNGILESQEMLGRGAFAGGLLGCNDARGPSAWVPDALSKAEPRPNYELGSVQSYPFAGYMLQTKGVPSGSLLEGTNYDRPGYDRSGYDRSGYDRSGYDRSGYDRSGYDRPGTAKISPLEHVINAGKELTMGNLPVTHGGTMAGLQTTTGLQTTAGLRTTTMQERASTHITRESVEMVERAASIAGVMAHLNQDPFGHGTGSELRKPDMSPIAGPAGYQGNVHRVNYATEPGRLGSPRALKIPMMRELESALSSSLAGGNSVGGGASLAGGNSVGGGASLAGGNSLGRGASLAGGNSLGGMNSLGGVNPLGGRNALGSATCLGGRHPLVREDSLVGDSSLASMGDATLNFDFDLTLNSQISDLSMLAQEPSMRDGDTPRGRTLSEPDERALSARRNFL